MNIALINFSGNVGKTTLAFHLLKPRFENVLLIGVETINDSSNFYDIKVNSKNFNKIQEELLLNENVILDIGSSNVEQTLVEIKKFKGSHEDIDYFIIPVTTESKQQVDSISTFKFLIGLGVPLNKIRILFNQVPHDTNINEVYSLVSDFINDLTGYDIKSISDIPIIYQNELFDNPLIKSGSLSIEYLVNNKANIKTKLREAKTQEEKSDIVTLIGLSRLSDTVEDGFNNAFKMLFK